MTPYISTQLYPHFGAHALLLTIPTHPKCPDSRTQAPAVFAASHLPSLPPSTQHCTHLLLLPPVILSWCCCSSLGTSTYYHFPMRRSPCLTVPEEALAVNSNTWIKQHHLFFSFKRKMYPESKACMVTLKSFIPTAEDKPQGSRELRRIIGTPFVSGGFYSKYLLVYLCNYHSTLFFHRK